MPALWRCNNGRMRVVLEVVFSVAFVGLFAFIAAVRFGWALPRFGRWLNRKLGGNWFYDQR
jgi:hypothetical protein